MMRISIIEDNEQTPGDWKPRNAVGHADRWAADDTRNPLQVIQQAVARDGQSMSRL